MNNDLHFVAHKLIRLCAVLMNFMEILVSQGRSSSAKSFDLASRCSATTAEICRQHCSQRHQFSCKSKEVSTIWQRFNWFLAIFLLRMRRNGHFQLPTEILITPLDSVTLVSYKIRIFWQLEYIFGSFFAFLQPEIRRISISSLLDLITMTINDHLLVKISYRRFLFHFGPNFPLLGEFLGVKY